MPNSRIKIVHDVTCRNPAIPRRDADRMFYFACLAGGCSKTQTRVLYLGIRLGDWASGTRKLTPAITPPRWKKTQEQTDPDHGSFRKLARSAWSWFKRGLRLLLRRLQTQLPLPAFYRLCSPMRN